MSKPPTPAADRFWEKVQKREPDECWEWTGGKYYNGYGQFYERPNKIVAHRFSYELANGGKADRDLVVCHTCDNRSCVNPNHLFLGTQSINLQDMVAKGRQVLRDTAGEENGRAIINEDQVREIRKRYADGGISAKNLGKEYGLGETTTWHIIKKTSWKHVV